MQVLISQEVDTAIDRLFPAESSGEYDLPSQHQFASEALPLIIEFFATYFTDLAMPLSGRPDVRIAEFENLLVPLVTVTGQRVYNFTQVGHDHILLTKLTITPQREIYNGGVPETE